MMHRVSSRPRLVSDADASFRATLELDDCWDMDANGPIQRGSFDDSFASCLSTGNSNASLADLEGRITTSLDLGKRKRNRWTPPSSCGDLFHPLCFVDGGAAPPACAAPEMHLEGLPEEAVVNVATFLYPRQIRTLSITSRTMRRTLTESQGAVENVWMNVLRNEFPNVFGANGNVKAADVGFVDSLQLPMFGVQENAYEEENRVNLSMLTGLIPKAYPRGLDPKTLSMERHPFRKLKLNLAEIDDAERIDADMIGDERSSVKTLENKSLVSVVQFTGLIGTGDRCIRSDMPFPALESIEDNASASSSRYRRLPSMLSRRNKGIKRCNSNNNAVVDPPSFQPSTPTTSNTFQSLGLFATPPAMSPLLSPPRPSNPATHPNSPLYRFLSSLSKSNSSIHDELGFDTSHCSSDSFVQTADSSDEEEIGVNNYGMFRFGIKCKERLGKLSRGKKVLNNLKPFVAPFAIQKGCSFKKKKMTVDLTPRLVAYFEVTILKNAAGAEEEVDIVRPAAERARLPVPVEVGRVHATIRRTHTVRAADLAPRVHPPRPWRGPRWRMIPPAIPPMHPLVGLAVQDELWLPPVVDFPPRPAERIRVHVQHNGGDVRGRVALRPPPRANNGGVQRHECVAIGLSTLAFSPRDKMPGWDENSYGWHGDDGGIFHGRGDMIQSLNTPFGPGDVVGCGLDYITKKIFFVKNGEFLGYAFDALREDVIEKGLYPTVGVDTECPLFINFGEKPFKFDLSGFASKGCQVAED